MADGWALGLWQHGHVRDWQAMPMPMPIPVPTPRTVIPAVSSRRTISSRANTRGTPYDGAVALAETLGETAYREAAAAGDPQALAGPGTSDPSPQVIPSQRRRGRSKRLWHKPEFLHHVQLIEVELVLGNQTILDGGEFTGSHIYCPPRCRNALP
jgi:hypothetical protein